MKFNVSAAISLFAIGIALSNATHAEMNINIGGSPAPVMAAPGVMTPGWHGDQYYDGHRSWARKDWEEHQRQMARDHHDDHRGDHRVDDAGHRHLDDMRHGG